MTPNPIVPTVKDDPYAVRALANASKHDILFAADELLEWLQDGNWPVSLPVALALSNHITELSDTVVNILRGYDSIWKYWCIRFMIMELEMHQIPESIMDELRRIAESPTKSDIEEGAAEAAAEVLLGHY